MSFKSSLILCAYKAATALIAPLGAMFLAYKKRRDPPYGRRIFELLGFYNVSFRRSIWFHTVSVGEVNAAAPLIKAFVKNHPKLNVVVTTTTTTGAEQVKKISGVTHLFAPLDSPIALRRFTNAIKPSHLFIMETELWPNLLDEAHKKNIKLIVFNARMPEKTCIKYEEHLTLIKDLISNKLDEVICQTEDDAKRFIRIGVPENKVSISGSLKYDLKPNEALFFDARTGIKPHFKDKFVLCAFSTHEGEEALLIDACIQIRSKHPNLRFIIVPRHPQDTAATIKCLKEKSLPYALRSSFNQNVAAWGDEILIGDTMGEMELYLGLSDATFAGGSFVDIGGHNPLEPAFFALPVITGPIYYNFKDLFETLFDCEGAILVHNKEDLISAVSSLMVNPDRLKRVGLNAMAVQQQGRGALDKTLKTIEANLTR